MKEINTKEMLKAYREWQKAFDRYESEKKWLEAGYGTQEKVHTACAAIQKCKDTFVASSAKLTEAIKEAEGRASERLIESLEVIRAIDKIETGLNIPKNKMDGIRIEVDENAQDFPNAYKYTPMSTHFYAEFRSGSWRVWEIRRERCNRASGRFSLFLPTAAECAILDRIERGIF